MNRCRGGRADSIVIADGDAVSLSTGQRGDFTVVECVAGAVEPSAAPVLYGRCVEARGPMVLPDYQSMVGVTVSVCLNVGWRTRG